jgi:LDH2 family malate/lactate/ureidoglycolate dehydrogenase
VTAAASDVRIPLGELRRLGETLLTGAGVRTDDAALTVDCLLDADCRGVPSHGLVRLPSYLAQIAAGEVDIAATPQLHDHDGPAGHVDALRSLGAVSSALAMRSAVERADRHGVGAVTVRHSNHFGAAAYYTQMAAEAGRVGLTATSTPGVMAPWGAAAPVLGNNPLSIAAPAGLDHPPFVLDMAQTSVARGRIKLAEDAGETIPEGWALDAAGRPTTDPSAALDGALLPSGGYKGSALAMGLEILAAVVSGSALSFELTNTGLTGRVAPGSTPAGAGGVGVLHVALDPERLGARPDWPLRVLELAAAVLGARPAEGFPAPRVPGDAEAALAQRARRDGVPMHPSTAAALRRLAGEAGVPLPPALAGEALVEEQAP